MIVFQKIIYKCMGCMIVLLAVAWMLPQSLYSDCIHPVISEEQEEDTVNAEDYVRLFRIEEDNYKIVWKLAQKD